jgi:hypothetical protein
MNGKYSSKREKSGKDASKKPADISRESKITKKKSKRGTSNFLLTTYQMIEVC